jgi:hypothetical protein
MKNIILRGLLAGALAASLVPQLAAITLDTSSSNYIGLIVDGIPSNPVDEVGYINTLIAQTAPSGPTAIGTETYTRSGFTPVSPLPTALVAGAVKDDNPAGNTINLSGFSYLLGKYDAAQAGSLVWYIGGLSGDFTVQDLLNGHELSHLSAYNGSTLVPDGGSTVALLGGALMLLAVAARRRLLATTS